MNTLTKRFDDEPYVSWQGWRVYAADGTDLMCRQSRVEYRGYLFRFPWEWLDDPVTIGRWARDLQSIVASQ